MPDNINSNTDPEMSLLTMQRGHGEKNHLSVTIKREATVRKRENTPTKLLCHVHYGTFALILLLIPALSAAGESSSTKSHQNNTAGKETAAKCAGMEPWRGRNQCRHTEPTESRGH